jgi:hypothetical protein
MNRYFEDARYYAKRAGETTVRGVREELAPVTERIERLTGEDEDPEPTRGEAVRVKAEKAVMRARAEARRAVAEGREKLAAVRSA